MKRSLRTGMVIVLWIVSGFSPVVDAAITNENSEDFFDMNIEELLAVDIYSVSKSPRKLKESPAAIYILTCEDIRRSGATSLPELFRMVPGMNVARSESGRWQVSARGFNQSFSTKLLVLIDGRTVYNPLQSGVYWDAQDVVMEDLERIEIIRGPGAALWGANAVNGVINIITKHAKDTQGGMVSIIAGDEDKSITSARYGGRAGEAWYRIFVKHSDRDASWIAEDEPVDDSDLLHGGFRIDWEVSKRDYITLQGDIYDGQNESHLVTMSLLSPHYSTVVEKNEISGMNLMGRYVHESPMGDNMALQLYYDRIKRSSLMQVDETRDTFSIEFQHLLHSIGRQSFMWGVDCRSTEDKTVSHGALSFDPTDKQDSLCGAFIQDDISFMEGDVHAIMGVKYEYNEYTGSEWQPSGRLLWSISKCHSVWAAVSRAIRMPSRFDSHVELDIAVIPPSSAGATPSFIKYFGSDDFISEELVAYEAGYRLQARDNLLFDITAFINDYNNLSTSTMQAPVPESDPVPHTVIPLLRDDGNAGEVMGIEVVADWWPSSSWRLTVVYSLLDMDIDRELNNRETPESQAALRSFLNLSHGLEFDVTIYYVDKVLEHEVDSYYRADVRLGWHCNENLTVSVVGQNVFEDHHAEFMPHGAPYQTEMESSVYGKVTWLF